MPGWSTYVVRFEKERETYRVESIHLESLHQTVVVRVRQNVEASPTAPAIHFSCVFVFLLPVKN